MYQVGLAEHIDDADPRFNTENEAIAHALRMVKGDQVCAVWKWTDEHWADVVCLIYQDKIYKP